VKEHDIPPDYEQFLELCEEVYLIDCYHPYLQEELEAMSGISSEDDLE